MELRETITFLSTDGVAKEDRPEDQPSIIPGIEPENFWLAVRDLTSYANLGLARAHTQTDLDFLSTCKIWLSLEMFLVQPIHSFKI